MVLPKNLLNLLGHKMSSTFYRYATLYEKPPSKVNMYFSQLYTACPRILDPIYILTFYISWVKTSWTDSNQCFYFFGDLFLRK